MGRQTDIKLRRYYLPTEKGEGWAIIVIGSDGYFSTVSDYGNYAFRWSHTSCDDFRKFLIGIDADYAAGKLCHGNVREYQGERTRKAVEAFISERLLAGDLTKDELDEEMELAHQLEDGVAGLTRWYDATKLDHSGELTVYDLPADVRAFCARILPRFQTLLRAELEAEKVAVGG